MKIAGNKVVHLCGTCIDGALNENLGVGGKAGRNTTGTETQQKVRLRGVPGRVKKDAPEHPQILLYKINDCCAGNRSRFYKQVLRPTGAHEDHFFEEPAP